MNLNTEDITLAFIEELKMLDTADGKTSRRASSELMTLFLKLARSILPDNDDEICDEMRERINGIVLALIYDNAYFYGHIITDELSDAVDALIDKVLTEEEIQEMSSPI